MGAGTFSRIKTWVTGETLTAAQLNAEFDNVLDNLDPTGIDDESANDAAARATSDPYASSSLVKATSLETEIQQLRYLIAQITGETYWYIDPDTDIAALEALNVLTTRGDIIRYGSSAQERLAVGANGEVLKSDGTDADWGFLVPRSYLAGLGMSNDTDTEHDILIAVGECADSTNAFTMKLSAAITKQIDATWVSGDDHGGMNDGDAVGNSEWFHVFLLSNATGTSVDAGFDTSLTAAGLLADTAVIAAGLTLYRRIGSVLTDGSANIIAFSQLGDEFLWSDPPLDIDNATPGTSAHTATTSTPLGVKTQVIVNGIVDGGANYLYLSSLDVNDEAPSQTASPLANVGFAADSCGQVIVRTNTSSQIRYRCSANTAIGIATLGWIDRRGRDD